MFESTIVRGALVFYSIFAFFAIFLLWRNAAAPDALKNTSIVVASILPVVIVVLPYIISEKLSKEFHYILIYDSDQKQIVNGEIGNAYEFSYRDMFINLSSFQNSLNGDCHSDFTGRPGLDIIEKGILEALMGRFISHWDIVYSEWHGPSSIGFRAKDGKGPIKEFERITLNKLKSIFKHNRLISEINNMKFDVLALPPNGKLTTNQIDKTRNIYIENGFGKVSIKIDSNNGGVAQQGIWGVIKPDPDNMNRFYTIEFTVSLIMEVDMFKRYSPEMRVYKKWYNNLKQSLEKYDWEIVNKKIEQAALRDAISKTLEH